MSFSYQLGANPTIDFPRLLVGDTQESGHIFEDEEITSATTLISLQYQSSMQFSNGAGRNLPSTPVSYLRVAAILLDALAASKSRLALTKLLDATVSFTAVAKALREQAQEYRDVDDNAGAFMIIEQCNTGFSFLDRFYKQVQRQTAQ